MFFFFDNLCFLLVYFRPLMFKVITDITGLVSITSITVLHCCPCSLKMLRLGSWLWVFLFFGGFFCIYLDWHSLSFLELGEILSHSCFKYFFCSFPFSLALLLHISYVTHTLCSCPMVFGYSVFPPL